jgi:hypothetical protein
MKWLSIALLLCCVSCDSIKKKDRETPTEVQWSEIGTIGGLDQITDQHITALLKLHGISSAIEGSIVYGVSVPVGDEARALKILREDAKKRHYWIDLYDGDKRVFHSDDSDDWKTENLSEKYDTVLKRNEFEKSSDLGAVLRHSSFAESVPPFNYVKWVKWLKREYLDEKGRERIGHVVEVELSVDPNLEIGGKHARFQVWDDGKKIQTMGSSEWWHGTPEVVAKNQKDYAKKR